MVSYPVPAGPAPVIDSASGFSTGWTPRPDPVIVVLKVVNTGGLAVICSSGTPWAAPGAVTGELLLVFDA